MYFLVALEPIQPYGGHPLRVTQKKGYIIQFLEIAQLS